MDGDVVDWVGGGHVGSVIDGGGVGMLAWDVNGIWSRGVLDVF